MGRYRSGSLLLTALLGFVVALSVTGEAGASHFPMVYPATAKVCCVYGDARDRGRRLHDGYDLMGQRGDPIFASYAGRVTRAENGSRCSGYGKRVTVDHGAGYSTVYAHLDSILVREGDQVRQMQQIGTMGKTGNACTTPVHLHYEVRRLPPSCTDRRHSVCEALNLNQAIRQGQNVSAGSPIPAHFDLPGGPAPGSPVPGGPTDVADISATPTGAGYHLVAADGGVFSFGGAPFHGSMGGRPLNAPVAGMAATPSGNGYRLFASDGGVFSFGDAPFHGSMAGRPLNAPVVGGDNAGRDGYWLVAADGGVFSFGGAPFYGSMAGRRLNRPMVGMAATPTGRGYWLVAADGGVFAFGDARFCGSKVGLDQGDPSPACGSPPDRGAPITRLSLAGTTSPRAARTRRIKMGASSDEAAVLRLRITVAGRRKAARGRTARRVPIATRRISFARAGRQSFSVRLTRRGARVLGRLRPTKLTVSWRAHDASGNALAGRATLDVGRGRATRPRGPAFH